MTNGKIKDFAILRFSYQKCDNECLLWNSPTNKFTQGSEPFLKKPLKHQFHVQIIDLQVAVVPPNDYWMRTKAIRHSDKQKLMKIA